MDNRPQHLKDKSDQVKQENDNAIEDALNKLSKMAEKGEAKPTVAVLAKMAGVSDGSVNGRGWAVLRLKAIKKSVKNKGKVSKAKKDEKEKSQNDLLKDRVKHLINQNVLMYDEILCLQEKMGRLEKENEALQRRIKLKTIK